MNDKEKSELKNYLANRFIRQPDTQSGSDDFLSQWHEWLLSYEPVEILNTCLCSKRPVMFRSPKSIAIEIYTSAAGEVPVVSFGDSSDFEDFITNLICKGTRPENISQMGASFIYGKTQRFLVLSNKYYSNVEPEYVGLSAEEWREKSMMIRREHECTHYYTKRFYGSASNNIHDELIADFCGIYAAFGRYHAKLFQHFMGIDGTSGGRLSLYTAGLSESVREAVRDIAVECSCSLEEWSMSESFKGMSKSERIDFLCEKSVEEIAKIYMKKSS